MPNDYSIIWKIKFLFYRFPSNKFDIYGHHYSLPIPAIEYLVSTTLKIKKEIYSLFFRRLKFLNFIGKILVKLHPHLFARIVFIKAYKL